MAKSRNFTLADLKRLNIKVENDNGIPIEPRQQKSPIVYDTEYSDPFNIELGDSRYFEFPIKAVPGLRMTQKEARMASADIHKLDPKFHSKWRSINRYWDFKSEFASIASQLDFEFPLSHFHIVFYMPMSSSWSKEKIDQHWGRPHMAKPDTDNLIKAVKDACEKEDSHIWDYRGSKVWSLNPCITITTNVAAMRTTIPRK